MARVVFAFDPGRTYTWTREEVLQALFGLSILKYDLKEHGWQQVSVEEIEGRDGWTRWVLCRDKRKLTCVFYPLNISASADWVVLTPDNVEALIAAELREDKP